MLRVDRTQALEGSVGYGRAVHDLRPVPVHDWHLDRRRRGRHDQIAARHGPPQTHAGTPGGAKKPWPPKGPKSPRPGDFVPVFALSSWRLSRPEGATTCHRDLRETVDALCRAT